MEIRIYGTKKVSGTVFLTRQGIFEPSLDQHDQSEVALTGGTTILGPNELAAILKDMETSPGDSMISRQPLWDSPWLWLLIVTLLATEWILRRVLG